MPSSLPPSFPPPLPSPSLGPDQLQLQAWPGLGSLRGLGGCLALEDKVTNLSVFISLGHPGDLGLL